MADRFPLIVNSVSKKIEELVSGDNLDLTGNGIVVSADTGAGKYLTSNGTTVFWDSPGDVYLTQNQTLTNKTFETCIISGSLNTITNIPNASLSNSSITINGTAISLGGTVTTPDNNTTYAISAQDGASATQKIIRLTSGGNAGAGVDDDVTLAVGPPASVPSGSNALTLFLDRSGDVLTVSGHVNDSDTITTLSAPGGTATSGALNFTSTGAATVSMTGSTININALDTDTKTKIRAGSGGTYGPADTTTGRFTFLDGTGTTVAAGVDGSGDPTITYTSTDTVTRIRGGSTGSYVPSSGGTSQSDITITGGSGGNVTVSQSGNTISIDSVDTNTVTKVGSDNNGSPIAPQAGDFIFKQAGATTIRQTTNNSGQVEIEIDSLNSDTGASLDADPVGGLVLSGTDFQLKNYNNLTGNKLVKWDSGNNQLSNSIINDDGTTVTIGGDLVVDGTQTILNTTTLQVEDNIIELRKGTSITGADGGIQVNRITDSGGVVTAYQGLQWHESGGYWRSWDGSVDNRFVTENETQVLTNKTLTNPTFTTPTLGAASATSINGLEITSTASAILDIQSGKKVDIDRDLTFTSDNLTSNVSVNFRVGGDVAYKSDTLASFSSTTATQLRTLISGTTGTDDLVFQTSPVILTSLVTTSTGFALLNSGAQSIQFGGAATVIDIGNQSGTTTISGDTVIEKDLTVGGASTDLFTCNARIDIANSDILIRGGSSDPMTVGRGTSAVATNTAVGKQALFSVSSGSQNTATGYESLLTANSGAGNTAYGYHTLRSSGVGVNNTAVGRSAMLSNLSGDNNVALGSNALETNTTGDANVCVGYYAGYNCSGTGNVLIGPADSTNPVNDATYTPPNPSGDRQLIIGSGTEYWVKGDQNFDVTLNNDVTVNNSLTVKGDFVVNGTQTVVQSNVLEVADKNIELAKVVSTQFTCTTTDGSANISAISPTLGLIPGMAITSNTAGVTVPGNTTIVSITGNVATLSNNVTGSGTPTFSAIGPSDTAANGGGIILKGSPNDHTFTWSNANDAWQSSEDMELVNGKTYNIIDGSGNARQMLSLTQIGPTAGTGVVAGLGSGVTSSSLTSVGTLGTLSVSGTVDVGGSIDLTDTTVDLYSQTTNPASKTFQLFSDIGGTKTEHAFIKADGEASFGNPGGVLGANLNNSVSGHFFVSQCDDNNDGFEIYQQHGSTSTRNTLAVYANTGTSGAKKEQFIVRGDGNVVVGGGTTVGGAGTFSMEENGHVRSILTAATAGDTLFGAISGVSNGFQINIDTSNNQDYIFHNGSQVTLKIDNSGQVQIGGDGGQGQNPLLVSGNYAGSASVDIQTWQRVGGAVQAKMIYRDATTDMVFGTDTAHDLEIMTAGVPRMTVQSTGEIVVGSHSISDEQFKIKGGEADLWLDSSGTGVWRILGSTGGSTHQFRVYDNEGGGDRLTIGSTGRVRLSGVPGVAGSNLANVSIESDGNLCTTTSLRKYKTNISSLEDTSWLFNLNPVTFDWKKKTEEDGVTTWEDTPDGNGTQYGLIAEEVEEVKDDFCYYDNDGKLTGVHYDRLIAPLLKVVQQQKEEIEALKARVANLES